MRYLLKTLAKNNREMRTSLLFTTKMDSNLGDRQFMIGLPEGIQRMSSI